LLLYRLQLSRFNGNPKDAHQNLSESAGPVGQWAISSPIDWVSRPNSDWPPKADTPMVEGRVQPRKPRPITRGSFLSQSLG
jgi:hypothetical protein